MSTLVTSASPSREQVILDHLPQVKITARKFHRRCPPEVLLEDLVSAGVVGLLDAYNRFDAGRNLRFRTLAEHRIRGAIIDYLRQLDPLSRTVRRFQKERDAAMSRVSQRHQRRPAEQDIAHELGVGVNRYRKLAALAEIVTISLDAPQVPYTTHAYDVADPTTLCHRECAVLACAVEAAIRDLPGPDRTVIMAIRNGDNLHTIADRLRVTEGRVSQIKRRALEFLRARLGARPPV